MREHYKAPYTHASFCRQSNHSISFYMISSQPSPCTRKNKKASVQPSISGTRKPPVAVMGTKSKEHKGKGGHMPASFARLLGVLVLLLVDTNGTACALAKVSSSRIVGEE